MKPINHRAFWRKCQIAISLRETLLHRKATLAERLAICSSAAGVFDEGPWRECDKEEPWMDR